ncbi:MAG: hypothetical protein RR035_04035, partial [Oscillibacter sp.]
RTSVLFALFWWFLRRFALFAGLSVAKKALQSLKILGILRLVKWGEVVISRDVWRNPPQNR